jgi:hypothetical protein|tara:strand:- start:402 stop:575 length:174 start_codon:yes stop_codon:yes gene_type:complete
MKKNLLPPSQGGLPAKEFEKEHGVTKGKAKEQYPNTAGKVATPFRKGGMVKPKKKTT